MNRKNAEQVGYVGDVYFFRAHYKESDRDEMIMRVGSDDGIDIIADSRRGLLLRYLLFHKGQFFDLKTLKKASRLKNIRDELGLLDDRFSCSQYYKLLCVGENGDRKYGLVDIDVNIEGTGAVRAYRTGARRGIETLAEDIEMARLESEASSNYS